MPSASRTQQEIPKNPKNPKPLNPNSRHPKRPSNKKPCLKEVPPVESESEAKTLGVSPGPEALRSQAEAPFFCVEKPMGYVGFIGFYGVPWLGFREKGGL